MNPDKEIPKFVYGCECDWCRVTRDLGLTEDELHHLIAEDRGFLERLAGPNGHTLLQIYRIRKGKT
jgi:hypothetical protein